MAVSYPCTFIGPLQEGDWYYHVPDCNCENPPDWGGLAVSLGMFIVGFTIAGYCMYFGVSFFGGPIYVPQYDMTG